MTIGGFFKKSPKLGETSVKDSEVLLSLETAMDHIKRAQAELGEILKSFQIPENKIGKNESAEESENIASAEPAAETAPEVKPEPERRSERPEAGDIDSLRPRFAKCIAGRPENVRAFRRLVYSFSIERISEIQNWEQFDAIDRFMAERGF